MLSQIVKGVAALVTLSNSPYRVTEVDESIFDHQKKLKQDDFLTLYRNQENGVENFSIVFRIETCPSTHKHFSIYRTIDYEKAQEAFSLFQDKLPLIIEYVPDIWTSNIAFRKIIQTIIENPTWAVHEILIYLGYKECFHKELLQGDVNFTFEGSNMSPLHLAVITQNIDLVKGFLEKGVPVNDCDSNRNTPLHHAASRIGDKVDITELLINHGGKVNARNSHLDTPLHLMVKHNCLSSAIMLLVHGAEPDALNSEGDAPLHVAVKVGNLSVVQALVVFDANLDLLNNKGETPRHLAATGLSEFEEILYILYSVGAKRCLNSLFSCNDGCLKLGQTNGTPSRNYNFDETVVTSYEKLLQSVGCNADVRDACSNSSNGYRVLCLDGGGIRGMILIQMLVEIEKIMTIPILYCFDFIAGTSTGGILALALATGKTIQECRNLYFCLKDKVFSEGRPYDSIKFENFLKKEVGETTVMSDIKQPKVMITATRADQQPVDLHIFRNYRSPVEILDLVEKNPLTNEVLPNLKSQLIWQVARATGAAPTYFKPFGSYIDGGLIANNPTMDALTEIHQCNEALVAMGQEDEVQNVKVVVSLGTGQLPLTPSTPFDVSMPDSPLDICRVVVDSSNLINVLVDQASQADGRVIVRTQAFCKQLGIPYFRFSPRISKIVALDETDSATLVQMLWETKAYMHLMKDELEALKPLLVLK